jgi:RimJ/RimL family protein N-acetyltransferase
MIKLIDVYEYDNRYDALRALYAHLAERTPIQAISHREMPSWKQHCEFVEKRPYAAWYLIIDGNIIGNIYLTNHREVGIHIAGEFRKAGNGHHALTHLRVLHPGPMLANINPANEASIAFFKRHGATLLQHTYQL